MLSSFASSYKYTPCTAEEPGVTSIHPCNDNTWNKPEAEEKCEWVGDTLIFGDCINAIDIKSFKKNCIYDMCTREDTSNFAPLCLWLSALSHQCRLAGVNVSWYESNDLHVLCAGKGWSLGTDSFNVQGVHKLIFNKKLLHNLYRKRNPLLRIFKTQILWLRSSTVEGINKFWAQKLFVSFSPENNLMLFHYWKFSWQEVKNLCSLKILNGRPLSKQ